MTDEERKETVDFIVEKIVGKKAPKAKTRFPEYSHGFPICSLKLIRYPSVSVVIFEERRGNKNPLFRGLQDSFGPSIDTYDGDRNGLLSLHRKYRIYNSYNMLTEFGNTLTSLHRIRYDVLLKYAKEILE